MLAEADNTVRDLHNSSYDTKAEFNHAWKFLLQSGPTFFGTVRRLVPNKDKFKMAT